MTDKEAQEIAEAINEQRPDGFTWTEYDPDSYNQALTDIAYALGSMFAVWSEEVPLDAFLKSAGVPHV